MAQAATFTVTSLDDAGPGTLRSAIGLSAPDDTIDFQAGLSGVITLQSPLPVLNQDVTIQGPGAGVVTISGNDQHRVFFVDSGAVVVISGVTIANGFTEGGVAATDGFGGRIFNAGNLTLEVSEVQGSFAQFGGGGISNDGTLNLRRSTITGNSTDAGATGGGVENFGGSMDVFQSTISGNQADFGGGIESSGGDVTLLFSTVAENSAATQGGGVLNDGTFTSKNSLVANSPSGGDCAGDGIFSTAGANMATDNTCPGFDEVTETALALGSLADNGGPTATHALGESSSAVDAAADCTDIDGTTSIEDDQRSVARPQGSACDIGAFELASAGDLIFADRFQGP